MIKLYNTLSGKKERFTPLNKKQVGIYSCGPTVYDYAHIGNLRAYMFVDLLRRYLIYRGFKVKHVMNITDVDDKTIKNSIAKGVSLKKYTDFYTKAFLKDLKLLNIITPSFMPRATYHIKEMIILIKKLLRNNYAYASQGSVYFKINKFKKYGALAKLEKQNLKFNAAKRLKTEDEYKKDEANDFVLWKNRTPEDKDIFWKTELGKGRPGWHIECSAMSMKYLGETIDIHTGGIDLIFPHHTNEIAQSEAATKKKFVNYWLHNEHLLVDGNKMSKSLNNFLILKDLMAKKVNPLIIRLTLLKNHYRSVSNFTFKSIQESEEIAEKFINLLIELDQINRKVSNKVEIEKIINKYRDEFIRAMDDDLNINLAFKSLFDFLTDINIHIKEINTSQAGEIINCIYEIDDVLGFIKPTFQEYKIRLNKIESSTPIKELLKSRKRFRDKKNFSEADNIRNILLESGIIINDTIEGQEIRLKKVI